jgi:hypothetical protein
MPEWLHPGTCAQARRKTKGGGDSHRPTFMVLETEKDER